MIYILCNIITFFLYGIDKWKAKHHKWRIPERVLLFAAICGVFGAFAGMCLFRHKIRKPKFYLGVPLIFLLELILVFSFLFYFPAASITL